MVGLTDHLNMTIVVDWDVKPQIKQTKKKLLTFFEMTPSFRRVSARKFAEKLRGSSRSFSASFRGVSPRNLAETKMEYASLREITRSFLRESLRLRILFAK